MWEDRDAVVNYVGEDDFVTVYRDDEEVFAAEDAMGTLPMNRDS